MTAELIVFLIYLEIICTNERYGERILIDKFTTYCSIWLCCYLNFIIVNGCHQSWTTKVVQFKALKSVEWSRQIIIEQSMRPLLGAAEKQGQSRRKRNCSCNSSDFIFTFTNLQPLAEVADFLRRWIVTHARLFPRNRSSQGWDCGNRFFSPEMGTALAAATTTKTTTTTSGFVVL